jgi:cold shock CspA family protein
VFSIISISSQNIDFHGCLDLCHNSYVGPLCNPLGLPITKGISKLRLATNLAQRRFLIIHHCWITCLIYQSAMFKGKIGAEKGYVKWYKDNIGFITPTDGTAEIFVHGIPNPAIRTALAGDAVIYVEVGGEGIRI